MRNPNIVKTVLDKQGNAMYFSRATTRAMILASPAGKTIAPPPAKGEVLPSRTTGHTVTSASTRIAPAFCAPTGTLYVIQQFEALDRWRALYHGYKIVKSTPKWRGYGAGFTRARAAFERTAYLLSSKRK